MRYFLVFLVAFPCVVITAAATATPVAINPIMPVKLDYSTRDVSVVSPNGKIKITVTGEAKSLEAWVTIVQPVQGWVIQVWPIERSVAVLWQPDGGTFALSDHRYANQSYVLIIGTTFHMNGPELGVPLLDLTPLIRSAFVNRAQHYYLKHYETVEYDGSYSFYARALRWVSNNVLLVGVSTVTSLHMPPHQLGTAPGIKSWSIGYLVDVPHQKILRTLSNEAVQKKYGINVSTMSEQR